MTRLLRDLGKHTVNSKGEDVWDMVMIVLLCEGRTLQRREELGLEYGDVESVPGRKMTEHKLGERSSTVEVTIAQIRI